MLKRTCIAFAVRVSRDSNTLRSMDWSIKSTHFASASTRLLSTFKPADPPGTHGTPVFKDIDFSLSSDSSAESAKRNSDPRAVFVVTGASRGIGLQFVKSLAERTEVRAEYP